MNPDDWCSKRVDSEIEILTSHTTGHNRKVLTAPDRLALEAPPSFQAEMAASMRRILSALFGRRSTYACDVLCILVVVNEAT
jgi:hypothetical protein